METKKIITVLAIFLFGLGTGIVFAPRSLYSPMGMHQMPGGDWMANNSSMDHSMAGMMAALNGKTGDAFDEAFLAEMIVHHQGAVLMAEAALLNAEHDELKGMARSIISTQEAEIDQMRDWQQNWYGR